MRWYTWRLVLLAIALRRSQDGARALTVWDGVWQSVLGGIAAMVPILRAFSFRYRALSAIGAAAQRSSRSELLAFAADAAGEIESLELPESKAVAAGLRAGIAEVRGDLDAARDGYGAAATAFASFNPVSAAACRARYGRLVGGEAGRRLIDEAHAVLTAEGIRNPARWCRMQTPAALADND